MNYSTAVMLFNENIRAVFVSYEVDHKGEPIKPFTMYKTLDDTIKVGDLVIVPTDTRHKMTVGRVELVDVEVDFESPVVVKWLIGKVTDDEHKHLLAEENKWVEVIKKSEQRKKREDIKKNVLEMHKDSGLEALAITNLSSTTDEEAA